MATPKAQEPNAIRSRAGYLGALTKQYKLVNDLIASNGQVEEAVDLLNRIHTRYARYESHELCMATTAIGNKDLLASHKTTETKHNQVVDKLQAYIAESAKPPTPRIGSLFSSRSSSRNLQLKSLFRGSRCSPSQVSSTRSEKLIEARVQAELTKKRIEQLKAVQEMKQRKYELELEAAKRQKQLEGKN